MKKGRDDQTGAWMIRDMPVNIRRKFVGRCVEKGIRVRDAISKLILRELNKRDFMGG